MNDYPPSHFANLGQPCGSKWGKSETEWIALAYVQALANGGDTWKALSREQCYRLLTNEQKMAVHGGLTSNDPISVGRFERVRNQIRDPEGAWGVGGFWNKGRAEMINGKS